MRKISLLNICRSKEARQLASRELQLSKLAINFRSVATVIVEKIDKLIQSFIVLGAKYESPCESELKICSEKYAIDAGMLLARARHLRDAFCEWNESNSHFWLKEQIDEYIAILEHN